MSTMSTLCRLTPSNSEGQPERSWLRSVERFARTDLRAAAAEIELGQPLLQHLVGHLKPCGAALEGSAGDRRVEEAPLRTNLERRAAGGADSAALAGGAGEYQWHMLTVAAGRDRLGHGAIPPPESC